MENQVLINCLANNVGEPRAAHGNLLLNRKGLLFM